MLMFWTELNYSSCGGADLQLSGMAETADTVKGGEHMKANYSRKGSVYVSPHFVCSTVLVLHSLQQMGFTLNGVPWEKKLTSGTHF